MIAWHQEICFNVSLNVLGSMSLEVTGGKNLWVDNLLKGIYLVVGYMIEWLVQTNIQLLGASWIPTRSSITQFFLFSLG